MTLLEALTSSHGQGEEGARVTESRNIYLYISTHLDFLITLMKDNLKPEARLLAAETVVNMLVNSQVLQALSCYAPNVVDEPFARSQGSYNVRQSF